MDKKFKITDEQNVEREANLITTFETEGKEYAVYGVYAHRLEIAKKGNHYNIGIVKHHAGNLMNNDRILLCNSFKIGLCLKI